MTAPAPTYIEPHWYTGIPKLRCGQCHKVVFSTEEHANAAILRISARVQMAAYRGRCGHWHLTRRLPKGA